MMFKHIDKKKKKNIFFIRVKYLYKNKKNNYLIMMNNSKDMNGQFDRMKQLMNYGLNESKKQPYAGIEYTKVAADGKLYGIVREGTKFYIKVSSKKDNVLAENFEYIGGFRNRKDHEYTSFASAQKNFDFKLRSLAEAYGNGKNIIVESWNPDKQEE